MNWIKDMAGRYFWIAYMILLAIAVWIGVSIIRAADTQIQQRLG